ncbi:hypothetical protein JQC91_14080 [Jannaschia sp. Os4]|uniref:hypothetical protein n=1 Tax=Jannaschia sp. Os4 TaxID=2807617 RepID=UPI001939AF3B|nr:hypothetical protein [Jannaschia sp. Os4]MBM2577432.1 hypothetical protein [Jannaschia sp. Os4]
MEIAAILLGPAILGFVLTAAMPDPRLGLAVGVFAIVLSGLMAAAPLPPPSPPDDWYRGIGRAGGVMGLVGAAAATSAQGVRAWRGLRPVAYLLTLLGLTVVAIVVAIALLNRL